MDQSMNRIRAAVADREWLQFQLESAHAGLCDAVRDALASGIPAEELVEPAGLTLEQIKNLGNRARKK